MRGKPGREVRQINIWLTPEQVERLDRRAEAALLSRSCYVRMLLQQTLNASDEEGA